jgi:ETC complex I subunit conserved region
MRLAGIGTTAIGSPPLVRIYVPARSPMQSGQRRCKWVQEFETSRPKIIEPLMGWTSSEELSRPSPAWNSRTGRAPSILPFDTAGPTSCTSRLRCVNRAHRAP